MPIQFARRNRESANLFEMQVAVRDGNGCDRHRHLSGQSLSKWFTTCGTQCTHLLGAVYHRFSRRVAIVLLFGLTAVHPLLHQFEGGALDAFLGMLTVRAMSND